MSYMLRNAARLTLLALVAALLAAVPASAASPAQIHKDAEDGSIDGSYSLEELRAADRGVSAVQREYYGWEDVYRAALRALADPTSEAAAVVVPVDSNQDGKIDATEKATATKKTKAKRKAKGLKPTPISATEGDDEGSSDEGDDEPTSSKDDEDDGGSPLIWLIAGVPLLIVAFGAWRMNRKKRAPKGSDTP